VSLKVVPKAACLCFRIVLKARYYMKSTLESQNKNSNSDVIIGTILKLATVFNEASRNFQFFLFYKAARKFKKNFRALIFNQRNYNKKNKLTISGSECSHYKLIKA
jgi:hypothetical protein